MRGKVVVSLNPDAEEGFCQSAGRDRKSCHLHNFTTTASRYSTVRFSSGSPPS
jgi:hypothetical protein